MKDVETIFQLKTSVSEKVAEAHNCKHYEKGGYKKCLELEIKSQFEETIGCVPPWFTNDYKQVDVVS